VEVVIRLGVVAALLVVAVVVARAAGRWQRPSHPPVDVSDLAPTPGIVLFTSTDCSSCKAALAAVEGTGAPVREITWELEGATLEARGVEAVPLTVVVDATGRPVGQVSGVPPRRWLRAAWKRATVDEMPDAGDERR